MKSAVETLSPTRVKLQIEVSYDELKPSIDKAYKDISSQVSVPGFRRGKVPPAIIDRRVGQGAVMQEAINDALPKFYGQAATDNEVNPVGQPEVEVTEIPDPKSDGELKFTVEVDVLPEITLPEFSDITVEVDQAKATDEDVDAKLDELRERFGTLVGVDRPAKDGDFVSIDLVATIGDEEIDSAEGLSYQVGAGNLLEGTDEALDGLSADESTVFEAPLRGGEHAGETATIKVTLRSVKERELPEADDEFAEMASQFDTLDELKADLRKQAEQQAQLAQIANAQEAFLEKLREHINPEVPQSLIDTEVSNHLEGEGREDDDAHREEVAKDAGPALARQLILDKLAAAGEVDVTQEELINHIVASAPQYGMDPQSFANAVEEAGQIPALVGEVRRRKALLLALAEANVVDADGNAVDLGLLEDDEDAAADTDSSVDGDSTVKSAGEDEAASDDMSASDSTQKTTAKKTTKKAAAKKTTTKKAAAKKTGTKKTTAKKSTAKKSAASSSDSE